jgi:hypothetical protein
MVVLMAQARVGGTPTFSGAFAVGRSNTVWRRETYAWISSLAKAGFKQFHYPHARFDLRKNAMNGSIIRDISIGYCLDAPEVTDLFDTTVFLCDLRA